MKPTKITHDAVQDLKDVYNIDAYALLEAHDADEIRVIKNNKPISADYNPNRVNVYANLHNQIYKIAVF